MIQSISMILLVTLQYIGVAIDFGGTVLADYVDDGFTRVDINGNHIQGDRPMTPGEKKAFWRLIEKIIEALKPWM